MSNDFDIKIRALRDIADAAGRLTPESVVREARKASNPLHEFFEWDDAKAGHAYRLDQARTLIASVRYEVSEGEICVAFVRDPGSRSSEQGYRTTVAISNDRQEAITSVLAEMSRATSALERAREVAKAVRVSIDLKPLIESSKAIATKLRHLKVKAA